MPYPMSPAPTSPYPKGVPHETGPPTCQRTAGPPVPPPRATECGSRWPSRCHVFGAGHGPAWGGAWGRLGAGAALHIPSVLSKSDTLRITFGEGRSLTPA